MRIRGKLYRIVNQPFSGSSGTLLLLLLSIWSLRAQSQLPLKFDFGPGPVAEGFAAVRDTTSYTPERGFGLISESPVQGVSRAGKGALTGDFLTSDRPFYFVIDLPEGHYDIRLTLGDTDGESVTTVKAESRRLMLEAVETEQGKVRSASFTVNVRTPDITDTESIRLKSREIGYLNWDHQLTLEFNGKRPCINAIEITPATDPVVVYLAGNSTVTDQENEPWASWGQMLPRFLKPGVSVANYAESGEALRSFIAEKRFAKIASLIKAGDYLFVEFAHNDQKPGGAHVEPFTTYQEELLRFINMARDSGATPVLVTSMHRRRFDDAGKIVNTLEEYPEAMRQLAAQEKVALIDLNAMSKDLFEALGPEGSKRAFVHYPAGTYPGQEKVLADDTHFNPYGAYELARCVLEGIKNSHLDLVRFFHDEVQSFDPAHPDPVDTWYWPASLNSSLVKPDGN
ncbi:rhamnogalacturonan acetylesterase [Lewinella sp. IMCC34191]|uniref:rhamnogalacturonan acetylesterase n=1 Tax=Lewinella sp. IMCC34191 TaxID=2259172 RepID=UPI000E288D32|nr:GDSL-type esterase/lipase family protein [Lewinella sp. IMCC34191]